MTWHCPSTLLRAGRSSPLFPAVIRRESGGLPDHGRHGPAQTPCWSSSRLRCLPLVLRGGGLRSPNAITDRTAGRLDNISLSGCFRREEQVSRIFRESPERAVTRI